MSVDDAVCGFALACGSHVKRIDVPADRVPDRQVRRTFDVPVYPNEQVPEGQFWFTDLAGGLHKVNV